MCYRLGDLFSCRGHFFGCRNTPLKACIIYNTAIFLLAIFLLAIFLLALLLLALLLLALLLLAQLFY